jgi:hypothetical protein
MSQRIHAGLTFTCLMALMLLAACSPGGVFSGDLMAAPHRPIEQDLALARAAGQTALRGLITGQLTLTEAEVTNLLRLRLMSDPQAQTMIRDVRVWFERDRVFIKLLLVQGIIPGIPTDTAINLEGRLTTDTGGLHVGIERLGLGVIPLLQADSLAPWNKMLNQFIHENTPWASETVVVEEGRLIVRLQ